MSEKNYVEMAREDAKDTAHEFLESIVDALKEDGQASVDLFNDYSDGDAYHHENHVDKAYSLLEAATILDQLSKFEETDYGLWSGQAPRDAISTQAAYTYGAAVLSFWRDLVDAINEEASTEGSTLYDALQAVQDAQDAEDSEGTPTPTSPDGHALALRLSQTPWDTTLRRVFADCLDDEGQTDAAQSHRLIASQKDAQDAIRAAVKAIIDAF